MPESHNSLSNAVAGAMKRRQQSDDDAVKVKKKLELMQQIAAQVEQMQHPDLPDGASILDITPSVGGAPDKQDGE